MYVHSLWLHISTSIIYFKEIIRNMYQDVCTESFHNIIYNNKDQKLCKWIKE